MASNYTPNTQYTPDQQKRNRRTLWILLGALGGVMVLCCLIGTVAALASSAGGSKANATATTHNAQQVIHQSSPTATAKPKAWTVVQSFSGNGIQKTATFDVSASDWRLVWSCDPSSFGGTSYNVIIDVYNSDGSYADGAVNTLCATGNAGGTAEEHNVAGSLYLDVNSEAVWTAKIEVLQ